MLFAGDTATRQNLRRRLLRGHATGKGQLSSTGVINPAYVIEHSCPSHDGCAVSGEVLSLTGGRAVAKFRNCARARVRLGLALESGSAKRHVILQSCWAQVEGSYRS